MLVAFPKALPFWIGLHVGRTVFPSCFGLPSLLAEGGSSTEGQMRLVVVHDFMRSFILALNVLRSRDETMYGLKSIGLCCRNCRVGTSVTNTYTVSVCWS
jgi:hypothetical protein